MTPSSPNPDQPQTRYEELFLNQNPIRAKGDQWTPLVMEDWSEISANFGQPYSGFDFSVCRYRRPAFNQPQPESEARQDVDWQVCPHCKKQITIRFGRYIEHFIGPVKCDVSGKHGMTCPGSHERITTDAPVPQQSDPVAAATTGLFSDVEAEAYLKALDMKFPEPAVPPSPAPAGPTPETDALFGSYHKETQISAHTCAHAMRDFARTLERRLTDALRQRDARRIEAERLQTIAQRFREERDEARKEVEGLKAERDAVEYCKDCNFPLSACGELDSGGVPTMDCRLCRLRSSLQSQATRDAEEIKRLRKDREALMRDAEETSRAISATEVECAKLREEVRYVSERFENQAKELNETLSERDAAAARVAELEKGVGDIAEYIPTERYINPYQQIAVFAKKTARALLTAPTRTEGKA